MLHVDPSSPGAAEAARDIIWSPHYCEALDLLKAPNLLDLFVADVQRAGVVGEAKLIKLLKLVEVSRLLERPLGAIVKGSPGSGKSETVKAVLQHSAPQDLEEWSGLTRHALAHLKAPLAGKVVFLAEADGAGAAAAELRVLFSEGRLRRQAAGGESLVEGRFAFISTYAGSEIDAELDSRMLQLSVDESEEQTTRVIEKNLNQYSALGQGSQGQVDRARSVWHLASRMLCKLPVVVPRLELEDLPAALRSGVPARRTSKLLPSLVMAHVLLHQSQRAMDESGRLVATTADVEAVKALLQHLGDPLPPRLRAVYARLSAAFV